MSGKLAVVRFAPIVQFFVEILHIKAIQRLKISGAEMVTTFIVNKEPNQTVPNVFAILRKYGFYAGGVGCCPAVILGFIREKSNQLLAEAVRKTCIVFFVGFLNKGIYHFRIQNIRIGRAHPEIYIII